LLSAPRRLTPADASHSTRSAPGTGEIRQLPATDPVEAVLAQCWQLDQHQLERLMAALQRREGQDDDERESPWETQDERRRRLARKRYRAKKAQAQRERERYRNWNEATDGIKF
jgi:hypothetical protein